MHIVASARSTFKVQGLSEVFFTCESFQKKSKTLPGEYFFVMTIRNDRPAMFFGNDSIHKAVAIHSQNEARKFNVQSSCMCKPSIHSYGPKVKKISSWSCFLILFFASAIASAAANEAPFITSKDLDLVHLLPPPPAADSARTKAELGEVLTVQVTRTPAMEERAAADVVEDIWRFADVFPAPMRAKFNKEGLPKFAAFFERVKSSEGATVDAAKDYWKRPRPHQYSELVKPCIKLSNSGAYPSGHASAGYLLAIVLAEMVPERRAEIFDRAAEYAENRIVGGVHFRSDIVAGRTAGTLIAASMMQRNDYKAEFAVAKAELRAQLGL